MSHMPLARRYRPQTFAQVLGQDLTVTALKNALTHKKTAHAYLFCGTRGCGKTTLARLLAKAINCQSLSADGEPCTTCTSCLALQAGHHLDVIEIDGASHRGIDDVRQIKETVSFQPSVGAFKVYIIDEVHMLTKEAFNALLKTLEEPPATVKFIFATTEPHKVPTTILSRCQRFTLKRIPQNTIEQLLKTVLDAEGVEYEPQALAEIADRGEGSFRDSLSLLDQSLAFHPKHVTAAAVEELLGLADLSLLKHYEDCLSLGESGKTLLFVQEVLSTGIEASYFLEELQRHYRLLLSFVCGVYTQSLAPAREEFYKQLTPSYHERDILLILDFLQESLQQARFSLQPRLHLEMTLLHLLQKPWKFSINNLLARLEALEERLTTSCENLAPTPIVSMPQSKPVAPQAEPKITSHLKASALQPASSQEMVKSAALPKKSSKESVRMPQAIVQEEPTPTVVEATAVKLSNSTLSEETMMPGKYETLLHFATKELGGHLR